MTAADIDLVGRDGRTGEVTLYLVLEHLGPNPDVAALQAKLESYVAFVRRKDFDRAYPAYAGQPVGICVAVHGWPSEPVLAWLDRARFTVEPAGLRFRVELVDEAAD